MKRDLHVFCSDVHLTPEGGAITERFLAFLLSVEHNPRVQCLHILGDLFHYWLGRGHESFPDYEIILRKFRDIADAGVEINFIWGNRDFLVQGRRFERQTGIHLRGEEHRFRVGPVKVKCVHGDLLCANDVAYQRYRAVIRSGPAQVLTRLLSINARRAIAEGLREISAREVKRKTMKVMDLDDQAVRALFEGGADVAVCGHIHREQHRRIDMGSGGPGGQKSLYVLGAWDQHAPFLVGWPDGRFEFAEGQLKA